MMTPDSTQLLVPLIKRNFPQVALHSEDILADASAGRSDRDEIAAFFSGRTWGMITIDEARTVLGDDFYRCPLYFSASAIAAYMPFFLTSVILEPETILPTETIMALSTARDNSDIIARLDVLLSKNQKALVARWLDEIRVHWTSSNSHASDLAARYLRNHWSKFLPV